MPHLRSRYILQPFEKMIAHSPIVGVFGHRQVGKSTFLEQIASDYISLDDEEALKEAQSSATGFLSRRSGNKSAIDECQLAPALFPALKLKVQKHKRPGQFILSGSVRFTSRRAIRESLTGRLVQLELYPMLVSEIEKNPLPNLVSRLIETPNLEAFARSLQWEGQQLAKWNRSIDLYLKQGGLPGVCFIRENSARERLILDILRTILDRDLRLVYETKISLRDLERLCRELATDIFKIWKLSELKKSTGISERTLSAIINALESVYLIRRLKVEGGRSINEIFLFEDQLEQLYLSNGRLSPISQWVGCLYRNIRGQFEYNLVSQSEFFHFRTRAGATMPLAIRVREKVLGFFPILDEREKISSSQRAAIDSFLKTYEHSRVLLVRPLGKQARALNSRVIELPIGAVLFE